MAKDPYKYFRVEARELVEQLGKATLALEHADATQPLIAQLLRFAHTLKGAARVVKQPEIADVAHAIEDLLAPYRDGGERVRANDIEQLLGMIDAIAGRVATLAPPTEAAAPPAAAAAPIAADAFRTLRPDVADMDELLDGVGEVSVQLAPLRQSIAHLERARRLAELVADQLSARGRRSAESPKARSFAEELRSLIETVERDMIAGIASVDRELQQVRASAEHLRLLPASLLFAGLQRIVRDTAQAVGVRAGFEARGGEIRIDAHVLAIVQHGLVQAVRNAVAHGIEPAAQRAASGKPREGSVVLEVSRRGNRVAFTCRDDGRGIDLDAVRRAAERRGHSAAEIRALGVDELFRVLLRGGISTTGVVTEVSGRGVGLDVVRESAHKLGGAVTVHSEPGKGFALDLVVPVSLSSLDALLVDAGGQTAAIPLDAVKQTLRISSTDIAHAPASSSVMYEGKMIPFRPLALALRGKHDVAMSAWSGVVVAAGGELAAYGVDRLRGTETIVLRPLPALARVDAIVAGASLDSEGNPQLVLDPDALVAHARADGALVPVSRTSRVSILVIDDSLTTRMLEQSILESAGYHVATASSGEEGLDKARQHRYALFLVDVEMPGMDGFTFIEHARADPTLRDVPAVLVTSRASPEDRRRGEQVGARAYIVKSEFDQVELLERIRLLVGSR